MTRSPFSFFFHFLFLTAKTAAYASPYPSSLQVREVTNTSKAGLAWPNGNTVDIGQYAGSDKVSWYYTWSAWPVQSETELEFVPMLWGERSVEEFNNTILQTLRQAKPNVTAILGMNEPDQGGQSSMTPEEAAQMWQTYLQPLKPYGVRLGSPATSSAPAGKKWLQDFFTACGANCTVDFIATHWYGTDAQAFINYVTDYNTTFAKPIWITEWACQNFVNMTDQCSDDEVRVFMNITQSFMDEAEFVERYSWFGAMKTFTGVNADNALMDPNGRINALGHQYINDNSTFVSAALGGAPSFDIAATMRLLAVLWTSFALFFSL
ncbi:glycosyl hydrolase catalytic core-domain-containing protein [Panaeolus papilionaceus]|nr:glycosyl hydrolase catalytic core-domain-containing protein [Panaeolus papilionaceus]